MLPHICCGDGHQLPTTGPCAAGFKQHFGCGKEKSAPAKNSGVCLRKEEGKQVGVMNWESDAEAAVSVWEVTGTPCQLPRRLLFLPRCRPHGGARPVEMVGEANGSPGSSGNPLQLEKIGKRSKWRLLRYSSSMSFGNICSLGFGPGCSCGSNGSCGSRMRPWDLCYEAAPAVVIAAPYPSLIFKSFQH